MQDSLTAMVQRYKDQVKRNYIFAEPNKAYAYFALFQTFIGFHKKAKVYWWNEF